MTREGSIRRKKRKKVGSCLRENVFLDCPFVSRSHFLSLLYVSLSLSLSVCLSVSLSLSIFLSLCDALC